MANIKISELTALTPPDAADLVPVTDSSASQTKRTTVGEIVGIVNGDVDVADDGTATISELPVSKLQDGAARQLLQTDAAGTGVEWTSNVDVPGTLDVTGATTLDSTLGVTGQSTLASAAVSDLTSGRVVLAGTSGELEDSAALTFNGAQLDVDGDLVITGSLLFEGSTADDFETTLAVTDPTADRTITLPDVSGAVVTTGDTGSVTSTMIADGTIVDADVSATAEIAVSKLANGTANQVLVTDGTNVSWSDDLTIAGNLTVNGTTTTVNTTTLVVEDKNIELGVVASPTDVTADGGGITLKGATDKTINWVDATDSWTSSEHVDLASGKSFRINGTEVLSSTTLGSGITGSSLTSVGTLGGLTVTGSATAGTFIPTSSSAPTNGLYLPGTNQVALSTNGTGRITVDASGNVNVDSGTVYVDAANNRLGVNVTGPAAKVQVNVNNDQTDQANTLAVRSTSGSWAAHLGATTEGGALVARGNVSTRGSLIFASTDGSYASYTERARIDSSGRLLVGTSSAPSGGDAMAANARFIISGRIGNDADGGRINLQRGTSATGSQQLGAISFTDSSNNAYARLEATADGTTGTDDYPGCLVFSTTADGASSPTERMRIKSSGIIKLSNAPVYADNTAALAGGLVAGDVYRKSDGTLMITY